MLHQASRMNAKEAVTDTEHVYQNGLYSRFVESLVYDVCLQQAAQFFTTATRSRTNPHDTLS